MRVGKYNLIIFLTLWLPLFLNGTLGWGYGKSDLPEIIGKIDPAKKSEVMATLKRDRGEAVVETVVRILYQGTDQQSLFIKNLLLANQDKSAKEMINLYEKENQLQIVGQLSQQLNAHTITPSIQNASCRSPLAVELVEQKRTIERDPVPTQEDRSKMANCTFPAHFSKNDIVGIKKIGEGANGLAFKITLANANQEQKTMVWKTVKLKDPKLVYDDEEEAEEYKQDVTQNHAVFFPITSSPLSLEKEHQIMEILNKTAETTSNSSHFPKSYSAKDRGAENKEEKNIFKHKQAKRLSDLPCMLMEMIEGKTLRDILAAEKESRQPFCKNHQKLLNLSKQLLESLRQMGYAGIFHQDLKDDNVMVKNDGTVVVLDFGEAVNYRAGVSNKDFQTLGSYAIRSPQAFIPTEEEKRKYYYNSKSDSWAIGRMILQMIASGDPTLEQEVFALNEHAKNWGNAHYKQVRPFGSISSLEEIKRESAAGIESIIDRIFSRNECNFGSDSSELARLKATVTGLLKLNFSERMTGHQAVETLSGVTATKDLTILP